MDQGAESTSTLMKALYWGRKKLSQYVNTGFRQEACTQIDLDSGLVIWRECSRFWRYPVTSKELGLGL
jgi:hypothetical protein